MKAGIILGLAIVFAASITSCNKEIIEGKGDGMISELARTGHVVSVNNSDYTRLEVAPLQREQAQAPYSEGIIEYRQDGQVIATVDFSQGGAGKAMVADLAGDRIEDLIKDLDDKYDEYSKVITEPLVKAGDCPYLVAGELMLFKGDAWVATFDYGDGSCDDIVVKTTADGVTPFSLKEYPEFN